MDIKSFLWLSIFLSCLSAGHTGSNFLRNKMERQGLTDIESTNLLFSNNDIRFKRGIAKGELLTLEVQFGYRGENFSIQLSTPRQILHPSAEILSQTDETSVRWTKDHPDCFLTGTVTSHPGIASFSICDQIIGIIKAGNNDLHVHSLSGTSKRGSIQVLVGRQKERDSPSNHLHANLEKLQEHERSRRSVTSHNITIEMAVYTDAAYTQAILVKDFSKRLEHILLKYYAVQMEWSRFDMLGYHVQLVLKKVHFYETNPSWYNSSATLLGSVLSTFCVATKDDGAFDIRYMHVGLTNLDVLGRAYQNSVCNPTYNCAVDTATGAASFAATAHEIGHLMGMMHDADRGCTGSNIGVMGGYGTGWSSCSKSDMDALLQKGGKNCLWEENIPSGDVQQNLADIAISPSIPGQQYSPDQICELKYGSGYRFRKYPKLDVCVLYSCANHNHAQSNYGQMFREGTSIFGMYCDKSKICFKMGCVDASTAKLTNLVEREGGWSQWGPWTGCTRTCGRGINYRKRKCDNPAPINFEGCQGDGYEAEACNKEPCPSDSSDLATLRNQRASETCKRLRDNNVINPDLYNETGSRYSNIDHGQCEVTCDPAPGHTTPDFTRFGFMPDGVACTGGSDPWDLDNWPRNSGSYYMCLDGLCQRFGCDDKYNGMTYDECGVCGGDNSTCTVVSQVFTQTQSKGGRLTVATLPTGAFNIQFWFPFKEMGGNYLEIYDKQGKVILASLYSGKFDTRNDPIVFAGTEWHFYFHTQFLHAKGPLKETCEIKLFQYEANGNVGVNYIYSESKPVIFDCDFEGSTGCGLTMNGFAKASYRSTEILDPPDKSDFGESFIYIASDSLDTEGTLLTRNITGTSHSQCLAFNYHITGTSSNIKVFWESKPDDVIGWTANPKMNTLSCAAFSISTLETDKILLKGVTKSADNGTIAVDNVKLFPNTGSFCNALEACTRDVTITTTPKPQDTTSGSASTITPPTQPKDKFNKMLILGIAVGCFFLV
ncbi:A disintegrin and metalloproteinase with thrombospondin motifs 5 isoform X2 [Magallana gigas]